MSSTKLEKILDEIAALAAHDRRELLYFSFYPQNFAHGTRDFSNEEVGAYMRLLIAEADKGSLPVELPALAKLVRMRPAKFERLWQRRLSAKFLETRGAFYNVRVEVERLRALRASERGSNAARSRWNASGSRPNRDTTESGHDTTASDHDAFAEE
jgi:uncharacterized protein YdaU (DUF1376 family)